MGGVSPLLGLEPILFRERVHRLTVYTFFEGTSSPLTDSTRRWHVTAEGLRRLAVDAGTSMERLLRTHPVSAHWQRLLLAPLDAVAVIYRLALFGGTAVPVSVVSQPSP